MQSSRTHHTHVQYQSGISCHCRRWVCVAAIVGSLALVLLLIGLFSDYWGYHQTANHHEEHSGIWRYCLANSTCVNIDEVDTMERDNLAVVRGFTLFGLFTVLLANLFLLLSVCVTSEGRGTTVMVALVNYFLAGCSVITGGCVYALSFRFRHDLGYSFVLSILSAFGSVIAGGFSGLDYVSGKNGL